MSWRSEQRRFNRVVVTSPQGTDTTMTRREFEGLRLDERVTALLHKRVRFFADDEEISIKEAMSAEG
jgi:hypothetical protein